MKNHRFQRLVLVLCGLVLTPMLLQAVYVRNYPITLTQPDGEVIKCYITGDEFYRWVHDLAGFAIIKNPESGYFVYAVREQGKVGASPFRVGVWNPQALGIEKNLGPELAQQIPIPASRLYGSPAMLETVKKAPATGTLNNIVIFIRFSDETEFGDASSIYDDWFNNSTSGYNSMHNYFYEASYDQLTISTTFYPLPSGGAVVSYQDSHPRGYYQPYEISPIGYKTRAESYDREQTLLKNAVDGVSSQIPSGLNVDGDGDGYVDNVCFMVRGHWDDWADLLWPHMWSLYLKKAYINGIRVYDYDFQLQDFTKYFGVGVLCHEMFHSLGSPDLYRYYNTSIDPVGEWDIMDADLNPPQHMGAYMKFRYGKWIASIPEITTPGTYSLNPLISSTNNCYKIKSPVSTTEYFVVEYREKTGTFESSLPGEGLLVYRINTLVEGNADGPPDEVYIYRPNGTLTVNGSVNLAAYSLDAGRTAINDTTNPSDFLSSGAKGKLDISGVGSLGSTISFTVNITEINVTAPAAGSDWSRGSLHTITWTKSGTQSANVKIQLYKGNVMVKTISGSTPNDGSYDWTIPKAQGLATNYRILVKTTDGNVSDYSDYFTISKPTITITAPTAGATWTRGTTPTITWTKTGTQNANVKIQLFKGTTLTQTIAATAPNSGSYNWPIPLTLKAASNYKIKIKTLDGNVKATSGAFIIN